MSLSVVILAAGQGKRMKSNLPKVLQPLAGEPLLAHVLRAAQALQAADIHVVYGNRGDQVRDAFAEQSIKWALQAEQLGTGHALAQAMPAIADEQIVLVLYGDVPLIRPQTLRPLLDAVARGAVGLLSAKLVDPTGYGRVVRNNAGQVVRIVEHKDANAKERAIDEVNTGLLAANAAQLKRWLSQLKNDNAQGEYYLTDIVTMAVRDGVSVEAVLSPSEAEVLGVNDKVQLAEVESHLRRWRATELMSQGATLADPARVDIRGQVTVGKDVFIDVNVVFIGSVHLDDGVRIGPNCFLKDTRVGAGTELFANCVSDRAVIGPNCNIGPFARLRPDAELADHVHIGNFVEVKKSRIGSGSKANHLTYIGDSTVGAQVNIGAGTVTVNYDGVNKWRTEIGDNAFIGSGSMLVAPVKVGAGANTGAGSTITRDAPEGKLTLARARQVTLEGWKRPVKKS
ncbi:MAG: bifunctional UDP-N-acetylglucosamine diphosphorylase/glucosamine-1-phosphate N-acetyltransferase GlmU [Steroidobacteraceae bacterium]